MAVSTFRVGSIKIASNSFSNASDATLALSLATDSVMGIGDSWDDFVALGRSWTLAGTAKYNKANTAQALVLSSFISGSCYLTSVLMYTDASQYFRGSALITGASIRKAVGSGDVISFTFQGKGVPTKG